MSYQTLLSSIEKVARQKGRSPDEITLIGVSKYHTKEEILKVYQEGLFRFGESRIPECLVKMEALPQEIEWHFIGTLQKNKVSKVVGRFPVIHSVESVELAQKIADLSFEKGITTRIFLQVKTSLEPNKHGFLKEELLEKFDRIKNLKGIYIEGLMTIAPMTDEREVIRDSFRSLRLLKEKLKLHHLSMGMSSDWPLALEEGSTFLRIGQSLFVDSQ